jgi:phage shock protein E
MQFLKNLFGLGPTVNYQELIQQGAIIIDVRSKGEYQSGHIENSINIPLDALPLQAKTLNKNKPVITCCASGMRSAAAKSILLSAGFEQVYNGGGWSGLQQKVRQ